jgi:hypothetical protein
MLQYDKLELLAVFGEPIESEEFGHSEYYVVHEGDLTLRLGLNVDTSDASVEILRAGRVDPLFSATYLGTPGLRIMSIGETYYVEVAAPGETFHDLPWQSGLRVRLQPVSVELITS